MKKLKAKLFKVTRGDKVELIIAMSKRDALASSDLQAMGTLKGVLLTTCEVEGDELNGVIKYRGLCPLLPITLGAYARESMGLMEKFAG